MRKWTLISAIFLLGSIQGCGSGILLATAAGVGGGATAVFNDRRHEDVQYADGEIRAKLEALLEGDKSLVGTSRIIVDTYNKVILLTGEAAGESVRTRILDIANQVGRENGVRKIHNEISLQAPVIDEAQQTDTIITAKTKAVLLGRTGINASLIKVRAHLRSVYLMGLLTREEAGAVTEIVRRVDGVKQVIPLFEYVQLIPAG